MIQGESVSKAYGGQLLFEDASFVINPGERCAFVGRNGSGKSTLLRLITGEESLDSGEIRTPKGYRLGYLRQQIAFSQPTLLEEAVMGLPPEERYMEYKAEQILDGLGFRPEDLERPPGHFSGGFALRIHLAKVLLGDPDCLLLDEPTNFLDITSIRWLGETLAGWRGELVLISHDRQFVESATNTTIGVHRHQIRKFSGSVSTYYDQLLLEEEVHEKTRVKVERKREKAEDFARRFGAKATKAKQAQSKLKMASRLPSLEKLVEINKLRFDFREARFPGRLLFEAKGLSFSYPNQEDLPPGQEMIENLSLEVEKGDRIAVIGKNGRGKSTILRLLTGELEAKSGSITHSENLHIGYFGQTHIDRLNKEQTVEQAIAEANPTLAYGEVRAICGLMMFSGDRAKKPISVLSGGERSRVLLGKIVATPCNLLLLDEPTNHLDMESVEALVEALENFSGAIILVTHSEMILERVPEKLLVCRRGRQHLFMGEYDLFLEKEGWDAKGEPSQVVAPPKPSKPKSERSASSTAKLEQRLEVAERELSKLHDRLEEAAYKGDHETAQRLGAKLEAQQREIDRLYQQI